MKWVILNSLGEICRTPFSTEKEAWASVARAELPLTAVAVKCVSEEEAAKLVDDHFKRMANETDTGFKFLSRQPERFAALDLTGRR
jgi:hypothetical protein